MDTDRSADGHPHERVAEQTVLVVDDDADLADTCRYWLEGGQFAVETAYGGREALDRIDDSIDVVLLDRRMPSVSGDDVLDEIRSRGVDCRVAMMTAVEPDTDIVEMSFDTYLVKPVSKSDVKETVEELLFRAGFDSEVREYFALESTEQALESREIEELREPGVLDELRSKLDAIRTEHEAAIQYRERQLDRLNRVNGLIREIDRALIDARTREEIEQTVSDAVADAHTAAFVLRRTAAGGLRCTAQSGLDCDPSDVDYRFVDETFDTNDPEDVYVFDDISREHRTAVFNGQSSDLDAVMGLCVPIRYQETVYGALAVYGDPEGFDDESMALFSDLGATVGNGINAAESKRLLNGDSVVELEFRLGADSDVLASLAAHVGCDISLDGVAQVDDGITCFVTVTGVSGSDVVEAAVTYDRITSVRIVTEGTEESVVEVRLEGDSLLMAAVDHGASIEALELANGNGTLALHVAADADHGALVEAVTGSAPNVSVVAKREVEKSAQSTESFRTDLDAKLTDRQKSVLETSLVSGYFEWPRGSTAEEVADSLGISPPTLHEHLRAAERKLIETYFEELNATPEEN